jgi:hypothetical protein
MSMTFASGLNLIGSNNYWVMAYTGGELAACA